MAAISDSPGVLSLDASRQLYLARIKRVTGLINFHRGQEESFLNLNDTGDRLLKHVLWGAFLMCVDLDCADEARELLKA